jgi:tetratricopeptide (TPR) repeat protein
VLCGAVLTSCASQGAYYQNVNQLVATGNYAQAAALTEQSKEKVYGAKNALLFYLDRGMLLHLSGEYRESNAAFEKAKSIAQSYFTKSITTEASTLLVNDTMRPYYGEDFERALINVVCALNYAALGEDDEALVEARQVDAFLTALQTRYGRKGFYTEDPFARYLMGMLYENRGRVNDAFISYYKALESYDDNARRFGVAVPRRLVADALRTARQLGFRDDIAAIERRWGAAEELVPQPGDGEIVVVHYDGPAPVKADSFFEIAFGKAWLYVDAIRPQGEEQAQVEQAAAIARSILFDEQVRMAFPRYEPAVYQIRSVQAQLEDAGAVVGPAASSELAENVGAIAVACLDDRIIRVRARTIARAAIKYALSQKISQSVERNSNNEALGWLTKKALRVASTATELADKRSWRSLPDRIGIVRLSAPAGTHRVRLAFRGPGGEVVETRIISDITVRAGKKTFVVVKTIS